MEEMMEYLSTDRGETETLLVGPHWISNKCMVT